MELKYARRVCNLRQGASSGVSAAWRAGKAVKVTCMTAVWRSHPRKTAEARGSWRKMGGRGRRHLRGPHFLLVEPPPRAHAPKSWESWGGAGLLTRGPLANTILFSYVSVGGTPGGRDGVHRADWPLFRSGQPREVPACGSSDGAGQARPIDVQDYVLGTTNRPHAFSPVLQTQGKRVHLDTTNHQTCALRWPRRAQQPIESATDWSEPPQYRMPRVGAFCAPSRPPSDACEGTHARAPCGSTRAKARRGRRPGVERLR